MYPRRAQPAAEIERSTGRRRAKEVLSQQNRGFFAACLLAEMGDSSAYEPLIALATSSSSPPVNVFQALVPLGDNRAIEPLKGLLARSYGPTRAAVVEALLRLETPGIFEQTVADITKFRQSDLSAPLLGALDVRGGRRAPFPSWNRIWTTSICGVPRQSDSGRWACRSDRSIITTTQRGQLCACGRRAH